MSENLKFNRWRDHHGGGEIRDKIYSYGDRVERVLSCQPQSRAEV
jgi:hypothetical protein